MSTTGTEIIRFEDGGDEHRIYWTPRAVDERAAGSMQLELRAGLGYGSAVVTAAGGRFRVAGVPAPAWLDEQLVEFAGG